MLMVTIAATWQDLGNRYIEKQYRGTDCRMLLIAIDRADNELERRHVIVYQQRQSHATHTNPANER